MTCCVQGCRRHSHCVIVTSSDDTNILHHDTESTTNTTQQHTTTHFTGRVSPVTLSVSWCDGVMCVTPLDVTKPAYSELLTYAYTFHDFDSIDINNLHRLLN